MENKEIQVAKVLSRTRLVLNVGSDDGIKEDSRFLVYSIDDEDITDPITGNSLGKLEYVKGTGHVIHLQEKMCTIETLRKNSGKRVIQRKNPFLWGVGGMETETEEIPADELEEFDNVMIGDNAKLI